MTTLEQLQELYAVYETQATDAKKNSSYFASVLGMGNDHRNHPCHDQFFQGVGTAIAEFLTQTPSQEETGAVLQWLLMTAADHKQKPTYWYLYAIHGFADQLIPLADPGLCEQLHVQYNKAYPRIERMPVQNAIYKALGKRAKKG